MRLLFHILARLPLPVLQALGAFIGWLLWLLPTGRRGVALRNVRACFPDLAARAQRRLARRSLGHEMKSLCETPMVWLGATERVRALVREFRGLDAFEQAIKPGRGMLLLTLHQGCFEAGAIPMSETYPLAGIYKPQDGAVDELSIRGRTRFGAGLVPAVGGGVTAQTVALLAQGKGVYFMPDQDPPAGRGVFAPFFGVPAHTPTLVHRVLQSCDVPVVVMWVERLPWGRGFVVHLRPASDGIRDPDPVRSAAAMNADFETCVRQCPEQYWWGYKRFRRRPPGQPAFYK
ncbi:MAG: lysophospholipid acyltransferase family protein [Gammaproteobacteria bacterium]|nr:lysophospholipid acyltransferase family protein [Gammaproteobacteria bacterium]